MGRWVVLVCGVVVGAVLLGTGLGDRGGSDLPGDNMSVEELRRSAPAVHPSSLYLLAERLFAAGERDEAVFWFYVGQLRYRFHLAANPDLDPTGDPALFASLSDVIGVPLNQYAFTDIPKLVDTLARVRRWDEENPNGFTSKENQHAVWLEVRAGFDGFIEDVKRQATGAQPMP